jgi:hypothetical protein
MLATNYKENAIRETEAILYKSKSAGFLPKMQQQTSERQQHKNPMDLVQKSIDFKQGNKIELYPLQSLEQIMKDPKKYRFSI